MAKVSVKNAVIAINTALTGIIDIQGVATASGYKDARDSHIFAIVTPAEWTTANITLQASADDGATFFDVYDSAGTEYSITAAASRFIVLDPVPFAAITHLKLRSGTTGTPVNQAAERTLKLIVRSI